MKNPQQSKEEGEVRLAEEGTLMAKFQKERTDAATEMFERDGMCGVLHTTSKFFAQLDRSVESLLSHQKEELAEEVKERVPKKLKEIPMEAMDRLRNSSDLEQKIEMYKMGYNKCVDDVLAKLTNHNHEN